MDENILVTLMFKIYLSVCYGLAYERICLLYCVYTCVISSWEWGKEVLVSDRISCSQVIRRTELTASEAPCCPTALLGLLSCA